MPGTYVCTCPYGYELSHDGRHCVDVDECTTPANNCRFACKNLIGSFICICPEGQLLYCVLCIYYTVNVIIIIIIVIVTVL